MPKLPDNLKKKSEHNRFSRDLKGHTSVALGEKNISEGARDCSCKKTTAFRLEQLPSLSRERSVSQTLTDIGFPWQDKPEKIPAKYK